MPLKQERSFPADSPVGIYWLRNSTGFRVVTPRRRSGTVEEVGVRETDGHVDVLAVRRRGLFRSQVTLVPVERVTIVRPWDQTLVLAPRRQRRPEPVVLPTAVPAPPEPEPVAPEPEPVLEPATFVLPPPEPETEVLPEPEPEPEPEPLVLEPQTVVLPPPDPKPPREPRVGPALRGAGASGGRAAAAAGAVGARRLRSAGGASGRRLKVGGRVGARGAKAVGAFLLAFLAAVAAGLVLAARRARANAPSLRQVAAHARAVTVAVVVGLADATRAYVGAWRQTIGSWRSNRRWQESRPEPPSARRAPSPNGRPTAAPTRTAPPSRRG